MYSIKHLSTTCVLLISDRMKAFRTYNFPDSNKINKAGKSEMRRSRTYIFDDTATEDDMYQQTRRSKSTHKTQYGDSILRVKLQKAFIS